MNEPLVSVIIPSYNCANTVSSAIRSILDQSYKNLEVIVVDDCSTDATEEIVRKMGMHDGRVHYLKTPEQDPYRFDVRLNHNINAGYSARNFGFKHVRGEYITFQDADDVSLTNRIKVQYDLLKKYDALHLTTQWMPFDESFIGKAFDAESYLRDNHESIMTPDEIYKVARTAKGLIPKFFPALSRAIPFYIKRKRLINKFFFGTLAPYPGAAGIPFFHKSVLEKVAFRPLKDRLWPSFMGRGADRDFNFEVAETFKRSFMVPVPLYMWQTRENNNPNAFREKYSRYMR